MITVVNCLGTSGSTTIIYRVSENKFIPVTAPTTGAYGTHVPNFTMYLSQARTGMGPGNSSFSYPVTSVASHPPTSMASVLWGWGSSLLSSMSRPFSFISDTTLPRGPLKVPISLLDVSGQDGFQRSHPYFAEHSDAMIFTLDATRRHDVGWNEDERTLIERLLNYTEEQGTALLFFVNKMDRQDARTVREVIISLRLDEQLQRYERLQSSSPSFVPPRWLVMGCSAKTGEGIQEGMEWIVSYALEKRARTDAMKKNYFFK